MVEIAVFLSSLIAAGRKFRSALVSMGSKRKTKSGMDTVVSCGSPVASYPLACLSVHLPRTATLVLFITPQSAPLTRWRREKMGGAEHRDRLVWGSVVFFFWFFFSPSSALFFSGTTADCYTHWEQLVSGRALCMQTGSLPCGVQCLAPHGILPPSLFHPSSSLDSSSSTSFDLQLCPQRQWLTLKQHN